MTLSTKVKAMVLTDHGGIDKLDWPEDTPVPQPAAGEVLIRVGEFASSRPVTKRAAGPVPRRHAWGSAALMALQGLWSGATGRGEDAASRRIMRRLVWS